MHYLLPRLARCFPDCGPRALLVLCLLVAGSIGLAPQTFAQDDVSLLLRHYSVGEDEGRTIVDTLSNADLAVYEYRSDRRPDKALNLKSTFFSPGREGLADSIGTSARSVRRDSTGSNGKTDPTYQKTEDSGNVLYILAKKGNQFYESYVEMGENRYAPGLDRIETGNMTMVPVPEEHRETMRDAWDEFEATSGSSNSADTDLPQESGHENESMDSGDTAYESAAQTPWITLRNVGGLLVGILIVSIGGWWLITRKPRRRSGASGHTNTRHAAHNSPNQANALTSEQSKNRELDKQKANLREKNASLREKNANLEQEIERKDETIKGLRKQLQSTEGRTPSDSRRKSSQGHNHQQSGKPSASRHRQGRSSSTASQRRAGSAPPQTAEKIGREFVQWCTQAGAAMVDRHSIFANRLQDILPGTRLQRIFREKNAAGVVFTEDAQDAVEYWHVHVDGRDFLLPQPHRNGFRELEKCFEVRNSSFSQIQSMTPAELISQGNKMMLGKKGHVS